MSLNIEKKKAVVVGGSRGIGLATAKLLMEKEYFVYILDCVEPQNAEFNFDKNGNFRYINCNLLDFNEELFEKLADNKTVEYLMITAGIGRISDFEFMHTAEIGRTMNINATAVIKIIRIFYDRIQSKERFYCSIMGSIAGLVSSPMFSVYAASKAAVCRFVESVNIELESKNTCNRILNVSPGSIKGTSFNGGETDLQQLTELAEQIYQHVINADTLFIPAYEEVYKGVIERYQTDAHEYGLHSYSYKQNSGRSENQHKVCIGYLSGTFDLFHIGHLNLLKKAKEKCDYLIVGVHPNAKHKNKETFISLEERKQIVASCKYVDKVVDSCVEDSDAWKLYHYNRLFVGSDYKGTDRFLKYEEYFKEKDVEIVYFPYTQGTSSTQIRNAVTSNE